MSESIISMRPLSNAALPVSWAGRTLSGIAVLFLAMDGLMKVLLLAPAVETTTQLGYPVASIRPIGMIEIVLLALYLVPRTSVVGAVLWTGFLGGAVATHVRVGSALLGFTFFPIYVGIFMWAGLYLRDRRVRGFIEERGWKGLRAVSSE